MGVDTGFREQVGTKVPSQAQDALGHPQLEILVSQSFTVQPVGL